MPRSRSASSPNSGVQRLPVNPRRHKVAPEQRKRVATACNNCNVRRVKCSGEKPCRQCSSASRECLYPVAIDKVTVPRSELEELRAKCATLERCLVEAVPSDLRRLQLFVDCNNNSHYNNSNSNTNTNTNTVIIKSGSSPFGGSPGPYPKYPNAQPQTQIARGVDNGLSSSTANSPGASAASSRGEAEVEPQSPPEEGRLLQDTDGTARYLGETSGATFLDNLKQFMSIIFPLAFNGNGNSNGSSNGPAPDPMQMDNSSFLGSVGRYQTSDSRPLLAPFVDPLWLPSEEEMSTKLDQLRYFIQEGGGVSGGVYFWGDLHSLPDLPSLGVPASTNADLVMHRDLAFYHAAFAYSSLFGLTTANSKQDGQLGETFFARAKMLLGNPLEVATYSSTDVAAMALMGMYMVEMNRRDAAYMYITTAMHISIMHGIHRGWSDERGKRVFWTVYILDRWMSCLMGRPPSIQDDAIRLDLPREAPGLPICAGLLGNIALARIAGHIVCNTYRIAPCTWGNSVNQHLSHVDKALQLLSDWLADLPPELQMTYDTFSQDRPLCTLHMNYNQLIVLTIRPMFLAAVKKTVADRFVPTPQGRITPTSIDEHPQIGIFRECSDAARRNLRLGAWLSKMTPASKLLLPDMHAVFNAAIILLLHQIVFVNLRTNDVSDISFALDAFAREAAAGDAYATDCLKVMQELAGLVRRLRALMFDGVPHAPSPTLGLLPETTLHPSSTSAINPVAVGVSGMALRSPGLEGSSPHPHHPQLHPHGHSHSSHLHHHGIPVSMAAGPPHIGYVPSNGVVTTAADMGMMTLAGGPLYQELVTWLDNDELGGVYAGNLL